MHDAYADLRRCQPGVHYSTQHATFCMLPQCWQKQYSAVQGVRPCRHATPATPAQLQLHSFCQKPLLACKGLLTDQTTQRAAWQAAAQLIWCGSKQPSTLQHIAAQEPNVPGKRCCWRRSPRLLRSYSRHNGGLQVQQRCTFQATCKAAPPLQLPPK